MEYFKYLFEDKPTYSQAKIKLSKEKISKLKERDPSGRNKRGGIIDIDKFLKTVIEVYRSVIDETKAYIKYAFSAADMDGSQKVSMQEFLLLFKYLEPEHYDESNLVDLFTKMADTEEDEDLAMSLSKFSELCFSKGYFKLETQYKFIGINQLESEKLMFEKIDKLSKIWEQKKQEFDKFISQNNQIDRVFWSNALWYIE